MVPIKLMVLKKSDLKPHSDLLPRTLSKPMVNKHSHLLEPLKTKIIKKMSVFSTILLRIFHKQLNLSVKAKSFKNKSKLVSFQISLLRKQEDLKQPKLKEKIFMLSTPMEKILMPTLEN